MKIASSEGSYATRWISRGFQQENRDKPFRGVSHFDMAMGQIVLPAHLLRLVVCQTRY